MDSRSSRSSSPTAGGCLLALGLAIGAVLGMTRGNALLWLLIGALAGIGAAIAIWLIDRHR